MKKYHGDNFWKITKMHKLINEWKSNDEPKDVIKGNKKKHTKDLPAANNTVVCTDGGFRSRQEKSVQFS